MKSTLWILVAGLAVSGCATTPVPSGSASPVPAERLIAFQRSGTSSDATLVLTRDKGMVGSGCYNGFFINGTLAARIDNRETATFRLPAGEYVLRSGRDPEGQGLCAGLQGEWTQRETTLREGETKYFRLSIDVNGKTDIQRADPVVDE